jgi:ABC-2 type transport system ATP-binding protein
MHDEALAIDARDLVKRYPKARKWRDAVRLRPRESVEALRGLSLQVPRGTVHGLLGANGAGKTTLLKVLATLVLPTSGEARVEGHDVLTRGDAVRASLGLVVAEERSFYWRLSGRDNLFFFAALHDLSGPARARQVDELLAVVGLEESARRPYREYSSGMRQRLSIARGLLASPRVVLMDEPTRALDPPSAAWIRRFVRETLVGERGATVLLATHDLLEAETTCDRLSLVEGGRIVAEGTPAELKQTFDRAARSTLTVLPPFTEAGARELFPGAEHAATLPSGAVELTIVGGPEVVADAIARLVAGGARVSGAAARDADLASLFSRLVARKGAESVARKGAEDVARKEPR